MSLILGGIQPFTTIDYPEKLAAVFFSCGCPLACPYCQNPSLQVMSTISAVDWKTALAFMDSRKNLLDAIVFSGGEPLVQKDLKQAMIEVKERGFLVGLHTSGVSSTKMKEVLSVVDWVGFDVKTLFDVYEQRIPGAKEKQIRESLRLLIDSGISFEARTTLDPRVIGVDELLPLAETLADMGVKNYAVQEYHSFPQEKNPPLKTETTAYFSENLLKGLSKMFPTFIVRRS